MATRILYVITKANWGGAQRYVYDLATVAKEAGFEVAVAYGESGALKDKLEIAGIRTIALPKMENKASFIAIVRAYRELSRVFAVEKPDIIHLNSSLAGIAGAIAGRKNRIPKILFTAHGWAFNENRSFIQKNILRDIAWLTILLSHRTITVSEATRRDVAWWPGVSKKIVVIRNGIECPPMFSREEARATLAPHGVGRYWVGMTSELIATKCVGDAIRAFASIVPKHPNIILIVLGEGPEREVLENLIRELHVKNHVSLLGFKYAPPLLKAFDLFIHTPRSEALGYALLEAGCAALPVVATNVGGIPEIIPDDAHGLLVPPRSPKALASAIESLMNDSRLASELGARLRARVQNSFSKQKMVAGTLALY